MVQVNVSINLIRRPAQNSNDITAVEAKVLYKDEELYKKIMKQ